MEKPNTQLGEMYQDYANRFVTLSKLFGALSGPDGVQQLMESLTGDEPRAFAELIRGVEFPGTEKCFWVREIVERVITTPTGFVTDCYLRDDLTPDERGLYLSIAFRHRRETPVAQSMEATIQEYTGRRVIPPGPFLEELKANNLVTCEDRMTYDTSTQLVLGRPERHCV